MDKKAVNALQWIVNILRNHNIPFQISGGLAAKLYGSQRLLNDIDIDIPEAGFDLILPDIKEYIIYGPERYKDNAWDILLITLNYYGQEIDISGIETAKIFNAIKKQWEKLPSNVNTATLKEVCGLTVPVQNKKDLLSYKQKLTTNLKNQALDIEALRK